MPRDGQAEKARVAKKKTDDAQVRGAAFKIDLGARRDKWREYRGIDRVIKHGQVAPVGGEEGLHLRSKQTLDVQRSTSNVQRPIAAPSQLACDQCRSFSSETSGAAPRAVALA
jgi:hypothetical protein